MGGSRVKASFSRSCLFAIEFGFPLVLSSLFSHTIQLLDNARLQVNRTIILIVIRQEAQLGLCLERKTNGVELIHRSCRL